MCRMRCGWGRIAAVAADLKPADVRLMLRWARCETSTTEQHRHCVRAQVLANPHLPENDAIRMRFGLRQMLLQCVDRTCGESLIRVISASITEISGRPKFLRITRVASGSVTRSSRLRRPALLAAP